MAQRVYRHDLRCPHWSANWLPKDGHSRGKQTYRCGDCHYRFTPTGNRHYCPERIKPQALRMYGDGRSISAISRVLAVKLGIVYAWIKKAPWALAWVARQHRQRVTRRPAWRRAQVISWDEMWSYVGARHRGQRQERWL